MITDFDFNISNYSTDELLNFFGLNKHSTYSEIIQSKNNMNAIIDETNSYDANHKMKLKYFIEQAVKNISQGISQGVNQGVSQGISQGITNEINDKLNNKTNIIYVDDHYIQTKESIPFNKRLEDKYIEPFESFPTNISRSAINNLKRKTIKQTVIFNTLYREDYCNTLSTDISICLPYHFKNVFSIKLSSLQLPNVIYCISKYNRNNTIYIEEDNTGFTGVVIMPDGNYTPDNFCSTLQALISKVLNSGTRFTVSIDPATFKLTISNSINTFNMNFLKDYNYLLDPTSQYELITEYKTINCIDIDVTEVYKRLGWLMGFRCPEYKGQLYYTSEGIYNGISSNYIYFTMNDFNKSQSQNIIGMFSKSIIIDNILAMVPLNQSINSPNINYNICFYNNTDFIDKTREYFGPVNIQKLKIQLLNQYGELVFLNNMDYSFSLEFEIGYDW